MVGPSWPGGVHGGRIATGWATAGCGEHGVLDAATKMLEERFSLHHSTLQVEGAEHAAHESACAPPVAASRSV